MTATQACFTFRVKKHTHRQDPETAWQAALAAKDTAPDHAAQVLACLRRKGQATATELDAAMPDLDLYEIRRRLSDLKDAGRIEPTGKHGLTTKGRRELEYAAR